MKSNTFNFSCFLKRCSHFFRVVSVVSLLMPAVAFSQTTVNLRTSSGFAVLAAVGIFNTGSTVLTGDIGSYPTNTITGFPPGTFTGTNHGNDATTQVAMTDLNTAYTDAAGRTGTIIPTELGGSTLTAGVYKSNAGTFGITGTLTLNGTASDVFIFQMATTLTTAASSNVVLSGGVLWSNIFWQVGSSATLGASSVLEGTILANTSIASGNSVQIHGRLLAGAVAPTGTVTLDGNSVLPVELTSFTAALNNGSVELNWSTATEVNNLGFEVQRSHTSNAKRETLIYNWTKIGFMAGAVFSNSPKDYLFIDKSVSSDRYSYRLKQIDSDGDYKYSNVVEVNAGQLPNGYLLSQNYPNPFNPSTLIQFSISKNTHATLTIFNVIGGKVSSLFDGNVVAGQVYNVIFNGNNLASGIYYYKLQTNEIIEIKKMLFMK